MSGLRVSFKTLGCKVNQYDTAFMRSILERRGYQVVDEGPADIYVVNTCAVTRRAEAKSRQFARRAKRENPEAIVIMTGCFPQISPGEVGSMEGIDAVLGVGDEGAIAEAIDQVVTSRKGSPAPGKPVIRVTPPARGWMARYGLRDFPGHTRAIVKIQEGCAEFCSYCVVPYARGPQVSRPLQDVIAEVEELVSRDFKEVVLVGTRLGVYEDLIKLLDALVRIRGLERIRLSSIEPMDVSEELMQAVAFWPKVCRHLHLPLQSGSEDVLRRMKRRYSPADYLRIANRARKLCPEIGLTTDVIVGFPGETEGDFLKTYELVRDVAFSRLHVFVYSRRPGTPAAEMGGQLSRTVKEDRARRLRKLGMNLALSFHESLVGEEVDVLIEGADRGVEKSTEAHTMTLEGLTDNYVRVWLRGGRELTNRIVPVRVNRATSDGVFGELGV